MQPLLLINKKIFYFNICSFSFLKLQDTNNEQRLDSSRSIKGNHRPNPMRSAGDTLHTPCDDARRTIKEGLGRENVISSSGSRHCLVFLSRTQTLKKHQMKLFH